MENRQTQSGRRFNRGDLVQTWFDTGAGKMGGAVILYGEVIAAGPKAARVRWESRLTNRVRQESHSVEPARDREAAQEVLDKTAARHGSVSPSNTSGVA